MRQYQIIDRSVGARLAVLLQLDTSGTSTSVVVFGSEETKVGAAPVFGAARGLGDFAIAVEDSDVHEARDPGS